MITSQIKDALRMARDARLHKPSHLSLMWSQISYRNRNRDRHYTDRDHMVAAAEWLSRAQDAVSDGGICGRYLLESGWTSSYPETTGYIVPTLLRLAEKLGDSSYRDRARRCVEFLLSVQLASGAFPGAEIHENRTAPSVFNTAQIIAGLTAWHRVTGEERVLLAARRAADFLVAAQDPDGAYRRHTYKGVTTTYTAHASCWLAELGQYVNNESYLASASRHLDWVLSQRNQDTGWFNACDSLPDQAAALTHTIAYTIWGVLTSSIVLDRADGLDAASRAGEKVLRRLEISAWLPGVLDDRWRPAAKYSCLTGNAQMALIWFRLYALNRDERLVNAALKAIDLIKRAQPMESANPGVRGGIPGSDPIWGDYIRLGIPNWAAKFFVDALIAKDEVLASMETGPRS